MTQDALLASGREEDRRVILTTGQTATAIPEQKQWLRRNGEFSYEISSIQVQPKVNHKLISFTLKKKKKKVEHSISNSKNKMGAKGMRALLPKQSWCCSSGDTGQVWRHCWIFPWGRRRGCYRHGVGTDQECCQEACDHRKRIIQSKTSTVQSSRNYEIKKQPFLECLGGSIH